VYVFVVACSPNFALKYKQPTGVLLSNMQRLHEKYSVQGLVILGLHRPEFDFERDVFNMRDFLVREGISYAVGLDNADQVVFLFLGLIGLLCCNVISACLSLFLWVTGLGIFALRI